MILPYGTPDFKRLFAFNTVLETIEGYTVPLKVGPLTVPIAFPGLVPSHRDKNLPHSIEYKYLNKIFMGKKNLSRTNSLWEWGPGKREALVPCPWGNNPLSTDCSKFKHNPCCGFGLMVKPWGQEIIPGLWNANANEVQFGPNGLVNASIIYLGAPIFVSLPHFLDADPALLEGVTGLQPDPLLHEMFLDIEPTTGMTFREHNRIQINARITGNVELYNGLSILYGAMAFGAVCLIVAVCGSPVYSWFHTHHRRRGNQHKLLREQSLRSVLVLDEEGDVSLT
ncbi:hypothetical protein BASA81_003434 [Batrachochytrium salamandrivorans]|nr:hypothetical protein BASA81_003434 [Batrachochytrium salamandrivorans]